jgi:putative endonuclease
MWEVYILKSINFGKYYVGYSQNAFFRLIEYHNKGKCKSTKHFMPYKIMRIEKFNNKTEALKRERQIKKMKGGIQFKVLLGEKI